MHILERGIVGVSEGQLEMVGNIVVIVESLMSVIMCISCDEHSDSIEVVDGEMMKLIKFY